MAPNWMAVISMNDVATGLPPVICVFAKEYETKNAHQKSVISKVEEADVLVIEGGNRNRAEPASFSARMRMVVAIATVAPALDPTLHHTKKKAIRCSTVQPRKKGATKAIAIATIVVTISMLRTVNRILVSNGGSFDNVSVCMVEYTPVRRRRAPSMDGSVQAILSRLTTGACSDNLADYRMSAVPQ